MKQIINLFINPKVILIIYILVAIAASTQSYLRGSQALQEGGKKYTYYNNYMIFKQSSFHLKENKDLYKYYPDEFHSIYLYSPAFAMFFGTFALLPDILGLNLWNILNALILLISIYYLPRTDIKSKALILLAILIELRLTMRMSQSNALIAGLIILAFGLLEKDKYLTATLCIVTTIFIKLYGIVALVLFIFYPKKWKLILYSSFWSAFFLLIPLLVVNFNQLKLQYLSWFHLLSTDSYSIGTYVMSWLNSWFNIYLNKTTLLIIGAVIFSIPLIKIKNYKDYSFRLLALSSILLWVVLFNYRAESSGYIIAMSGVSIWFFTQMPVKANIILLIIALIFTSLAYTNFFPTALREGLIIPYSLKVLPCLLIWLKIVYEMTFDKIKPKLLMS